MSGSADPISESPAPPDGPSGTVAPAPGRRARAGARGSPPRTLMDVALIAQRSRLPQMAAALSYRTVFGLIPVIVLGLVVIKAFASERDMTALVERFLDFSGLSEIYVRPAPEPGTSMPGVTFFNGMPLLLDPSAAQDAGAPTAPPAGAMAGPAADPEAAERLDEWINSIVSRVGQVKFVTIGWIGLAMLIYAGISMLVEIERAFNQIYRVPLGRSWVRRLTQYWTMLTLGTFFLVATFSVGEWFKVKVAELAQSRAFIGERWFTVGVVGYATTVLISTMLLLLAYTVIPNTRVRLRAALSGAFLAAVVWEAGKWGFTQYLHFSTNYSQLYGSIALIPLFLLWIYVTWVVVLLGLTIAYHLQHGWNQRALVSEPVPELSIVDPAAILTLTGALARRFVQRQSSAPADLARECSIPEPIVARMLGRLAQSGLVHRVTRDGREAGYTLACPPERIPAEEVLRVGRSMASIPAGSVPLAGGLDRAREEVLRGLTIAFLVGDGPPAPLAPVRPALIQPARPDQPGRGSAPSARPAPSIPDRRAETPTVAERREIGARADGAALESGAPATSAPRAP